MTRGDRKRICSLHIMLALLTSIVVASGGGDAAASPKLSYPPQIVAVREIFIDTTASIDPATVHQIYPLVAAAAVPRDMAASVIWVTPFADNGWSAVPKDSVIFPAYHDADCRALNLMIQRVRTTRRKQQLREQCKARTDSIHDSVTHARAEAVNRLRVIVLPSALDRSVCTALWDVIQRIQRHRAPYSALVVTDGQDTCGPEPHAIPAPDPQVQAVVVVVPQSKNYSRRRSDLAQFYEVRARFQRVAPWVNVRASYETTESIFARN